MNAVTDFMNAEGGPQPFAASFAGNCACCGEHFDAGDSISWSSTDYGYVIEEHGEDT
jgi:hypothetical protein